MKKFENHSSVVSPISRYLTRESTCLEDIACNFFFSLSVLSSWLKGVGWLLLIPMSLCQTRKLNCQSQTGEPFDVAFILQAQEVTKPSSLVRLILVLPSILICEISSCFPVYIGYRSVLPTPYYSVQKWSEMEGTVNMALTPTSFVSSPFASIFSDHLKWLRTGVRGKGSILWCGNLKT